MSLPDTKTVHNVEANGIQPAVQNKRIPP